MLISLRWLLGGMHYEFLFMAPDKINLFLTIRWVSDTIHWCILQNALDTLKKWKYVSAWNKMMMYFELSKHRFFSTEGGINIPLRHFYYVVFIKEWCFKKILWLTGSICPNARSPNLWLKRTPWGASSQTPASQSSCQL